jgi:hypothetical protein
VVGCGRSAAVVVFLALFGSACSGGGEATTGVPATSAAATTITFAPGPTRPVPPTTTRAPGFVPPPPPVAVGAYVDGRTEAAPVLGERNGWHLWIEGAGGFFVVDLDTGAIRHVDAPAVWSQAYAVPGGLLYDPQEIGTDGLVSIDALTRTVRRSATRQRVAFRSSNPSSLWGATADGLTEVGLEGAVGRRSAQRQAVGEVGGAFVAMSGGRIFLVDPTTGASTLWAIGEATYVNRNRIVWRECLVDLRCRSWVGTVSEPRARAIEPTDALCGFAFEGYHEYCDGSMSADGRYFLATDQSVASAGPTVFELGSTWKAALGPEPRSAYSMAGAYYGSVLSPDGRWSIGQLSSGRVVARRVGEANAVEFDVVVPQDRGAAGGVVAIG